MVDDNLLEIDRKRYADDVTVQELVRLRVENDKQREGIERLRVENERLQEALEARPSNEELKLAEKHCDWNAFKHAFGAVMKHRRSAIQQKESE